MSLLLDGLRILILEDEVLIAMDVEQLCRESGAEDVLTARTLDEAATHDEVAKFRFDAAILDVMLDGQSTFPFAEVLRKRELPFIFASGYTDLDELLSQFPDVTVVGKPYAGEVLIHALAEACGRLPSTQGVEA